jgi:hypothetical protein
MGHNNGRSAVPGPVVTQLVADVVARLTNQHPSIEDSVVTAVVHQAAGELVSTVADPEQLRRQLPRRADARLMALTGAPVPITSTRALGRRKVRGR